MTSSAFSTIEVHLIDQFRQLTAAQKDSIAILVSDLAVAAHSAAPSPVARQSSNIRDTRD